MGHWRGVGGFCVPLTLGTLALDSRACFEGQTSSPLFHPQGFGLSFSQVPSCPSIPAFLPASGSLGRLRTSRGASARGSQLLSLLCAS